MPFVLPENIWLKVLERDDFKCLFCNAEENLTPAHVIYRSETGSNSPEAIDINNIMTLCFRCHRLQHDGRLLVKRINDHFFFQLIM